MISIEKWLISTPLQKLSENVGDLGKLIVAKGFKNVPKSNLVTLVENVFECEIIIASSPDKTAHLYLGT